MSHLVALVGAGHWGKNHLRNLVDLGQLNCVYEPEPAIVELRKKEYPGITFLENDDEIVRRSDIQGVVIAAPARLHYELSKKYLLAGKDVLVEKPLSLTVENGEELVQIAQKMGRILMVGHILLYHSAVMKLKEIISQGELGDVRYIYSNRLNIGKLRVEENVLWSFAPHDISLILMLLNGQEPYKINSFGGAYVKKGIYDTTLTTLEFDKNILAHIFVSWLHPYKEQKLIVIGSKKMAVFDDVSEQKLRLFPHKVDVFPGEIPVLLKAESIPVNIELNEPLKEELFHFINCMRTRKTPKSDGREGLRVLKILHKAQESLERRIN